MTTEPKTIRLDIPHPSSPTAPSMTAGYRLGYHETSTNWLPADAPEWLAPFKARHEELLQRAHSALEAIDAQQGQWTRADKEHQDALRAAFRGNRKAPADKRVPDSERTDLLRPLQEAASAELEVLAEHIQVTVDAIREHEEDWLTSLREAAAALEAKHREAERLLAEARADAYRLDRLGLWIKTASDDRPGIGQQPAPSNLPAPPNWQPNGRGMLRAWHEEKNPATVYLGEPPMDPTDIAPTDILPLDDRSGTAA